MKIVVASQNPVKIDAVKKALIAFGVRAEVVGMVSISGVPEQPTNEETLQGAENRAAYAMKQIVDADLYIAIENGIFSENDRFFDKVVIFAQAKDGHKSIAYSKGTECPKEYVDEARSLGFNNTTVGAVMLAAKAADDHEFAEVATKRRTSIITHAVVDSLRQLSLFTKRQSLSI